MADEAQELRREVAIACRIVGVEVSNSGHVSARIPGTDEMFVRCRGGGAEGGMTYADLHHIRRVDFDGEGPHLGKRHFAPGETPIHGEVYRVKPEVGAIVHTHPYFSLLCGISEVEFRPVFGGFDPQALKIAMLGVPIYDRAATVTDKAMAHEMLEVMGNRDLVLLKGHGILATGRTVRDAVNLAIQIELLAKVMWELELAGKRPKTLSALDYARYDPNNTDPDRGGPAPGRGSQAVPAEERGWMVQYVQRLRATVGLPSWDLDDEG